MSAARNLACFLCGARGSLETAHTKHGPQYVCSDGYACASRANAARQPRKGLSVVEVKP